MLRWIFILTMTGGLMVAGPAIAQPDQGSSVQSVGGSFSPEASPSQASESATAALAGEAPPAELAELNHDMQELNLEVKALLKGPVGLDVDAYLATKMVDMQNIEINLTQAVLTYSNDPEFRQLVSSNIDTASNGLLELKSWELNHEITQRQLDGGHP